jgi:hypothetical protein
MVPFNVTNIDHNEASKLRLKKNEKGTPPPPIKKEVEAIEPVIAEYAIHCTATSFC